MSSRRRSELGDALRQLPVPDASPRFFDDLALQLQHEVEGDGSSGRWPTAEAEGASARRRALVATAAAVVVGAAGVGFLAELTVAPPSPVGDPVIDRGAVTVEDLGSIVLQPEDVADHLVRDGLWTGEYWPGEPNITQIGSRVLGAQLLSETNRQLLDREVTVLGGARGEYRSVADPSSANVVSVAALLADSAAASTALRLIAEAVVEQQDGATGYPRTAEVEPEILEAVPAPDLGDEAVAFEGGMDSRYPGTIQRLYVWRSGEVLLAAWATGSEREALDRYAELMTARVTGAR